jgi:hypothetical protein
MNTWFGRTKETLQACTRHTLVYVLFFPLLGSIVYLLHYLLFLSLLFLFFTQGPSPFRGNHLLTRSVSWGLLSTCAMIGLWLVYTNDLNNVGVLSLGGIYILFFCLGEKAFEVIKETIGALENIP